MSAVTTATDARFTLHPQKGANGFCTQIEVQSIRTPQRLSRWGLSRGESYFGKLVRQSRGEPSQERQGPDHREENQIQEEGQGEEQGHHHQRFRTR